MTDLEFDVLDELYFVLDFDQLQSELELEEMVLVETLEMLYQKEWIRCYTSHDQEVEAGQANIKGKFQEYLYLASKKGLLAHNAD